MCPNSAGDPLNPFLDSLQGRRAVHVRIDHSNAPWRARLRQRLREREANAGMEVVWLDGDLRHPWLSTPWSDDLRQALLAATDPAIAAAAWAKRSGVLVVIEGGRDVPTALQPDALRGARVVWLAAAGATETDGWAVMSVTDAAADANDDAIALPNSLPVELAAIPTDFTVATARVVSDLDNLDNLIATGALERSAPGRWQLLPHLRERLLAQGDRAALAAAKHAWHTTLLAGWPPTAGGTVTIMANVAEGAALWHDWWLERRCSDWVHLVNGWNRWARRHGEQLRVRFWHQAMLKVATEQGESSGTQGQLALGIARCESDLSRHASAKTWGERALTLLPADHPFRLSAYLQLGTTHFADNDLRSAIEAVELGLAFGERTGRTDLELAALRSDLAFFLLLSGRPAEAEAPLRAAIAGKQTRPGHYSVAHELNVLAMLLIALERASEGVAAAEGAVAEATRDRHADFTPYAQHGLAMALLEQGRVADAYRAVVEALAGCAPQIHEDLVPLVELTQRRVELRARSDRDLLEEALAAVERALARSTMTPIYPGLLLAEILDFALHDRGRALALCEHLAPQPMEGHVQAMLRAATRRLRAPATDAPPTVALNAEEEERVTRLLEHFHLPAPD
jgi:tetratricopeptide (TPR) repeat protein